MFKKLRRLGVLKAYRYWRNHIVVSVDGVEHFCSKKINCPHCLQRNHRNGSASFYHPMLSTAIVHPDKAEVFVLDNEPILRKDGKKKNDCEINAAKRLLKRFEDLYNQVFMVLVFDALYACGPLVERLEKVLRWKYIIAIKPEGNASLFRQFNGRDKRKQVKWHTFTDQQGQHRFGDTNDLTLNETHTHIRVNMLYYEWTNLKGEVKIFTWITNIRLTKTNVYKVMRMGRSRWKIENEAFNTLKNQAYNFEHNFGHGQQHLCTIFAYLMMMAFCVDQIQQYGCQHFKKLVKELKTRVKLWDAIRAVFKIVPCKNMELIFQYIAQMYLIQLDNSP